MECDDTTRFIEVKNKISSISTSDYSNQLRGNDDFQFLALFLKETNLEVRHLRIKL